MTKAHYKSRSWRRLKGRRSAGVVLKFKRRRTDGSRCECGRLLAGVMGTGAKSEKKNSRKYGGRMCPRCLRKMITIKTIGAG